jgi:hypothetical protein
MAQKFLSIANFEKTQHYKHRNPPWVRLYKSLFADREFMKLSISSRYLYLGLLTLCSEHANRVPMDCTWIAHRLHMKESEIDLTPLYRSGLLLASRNHVASMLATKNASEADNSDSSDNSEADSSGAASAAPPKPIRGSVYPEEFHFDARAEALAKSYGLNPFKEQAAFKDHHVAKGSVFKDWQAAFRTWLRNSVKFAKRGA